MSKVSLKHLSAPCILYDLNGYYEPLRALLRGKALLKPTIVGAVGATAHIRDGLMVAVDCAHGSVQRLQA